MYLKVKIDFHNIIVNIILTEQGSTQDYLNQNTSIKYYRKPYIIKYLSVNV